MKSETNQPAKKSESEKAKRMQGQNAIIKWMFIWGGVRIFTTRIPNHFAVSIQAALISFNQENKTTKERSWISLHPSLHIKRVTRQKVRSGSGIRKLFRKYSVFPATQNKYFNFLLLVEHLINSDKMTTLPFTFANKIGWIWICFDVKISMRQKLCF